MSNGPEKSGIGARTAGETVLLDVVVPRLAALESSQNAMNGALGLMLDTLQAQTNLLRRLHEFAKDEPAESPVTKVLAELIGAITELDASIGGIDKKFDRLINTIAAAYGEEAAHTPPPTVNGRG